MKFIRRRAPYNFTGSVLIPYSWQCFVLLRPFVDCSINVPSRLEPAREQDFNKTGGGPEDARTELHTDIQRCVSREDMQRYRKRRMRAWQHAAPIEQCSTCTSRSCHGGCRFTYCIHAMYIREPYMPSLPSLCSKREGREGRVAFKLFPKVVIGLAAFSNSESACFAAQ